MTSTGKYTALLERLPNDVATLVRIVQGLTSMNKSHPQCYGVELPDERKSESHIREVERMLDRLFAIDRRPLNVGRSAAGAGRTLPNLAFSRVT
jgi:hypothetical protein